MSKSNNILVSFPTSGYIELPAGNTDVDFITGKALLSDGSVEELGNRIRRDSQLKSVLIISKKDINIKVSSNTKEDAYIGLVPTGALRLTNITFDHIRIITTEATDVFLVASMDPNGAEAGSVFASTSQLIGAVGDGRKTVTAAGTAEAVAGSTSIKEVTFTAETDNTDIIVIGGSTVVAALATRRGTPLYPGDSVTFTGDDLADFYIDSLVNGEGVTYTYLV